LEYFNLTLEKGIDVNTNTDGQGFVYSNTVSGCTKGIETSWQDTVAKNNIAFNNTDDYLGDYYPGETSTNNAYSEGSDPGSNGLNITGNSSSDLFVDFGIDDFHLKSGSVLIDAGADLSSDGYLNFSDDIDGDNRSGTWDIGADEYVAPTLKNIYYSVGTNSSDLKLGSPNIDITSGVATFSVAQADKIGVGDQINYSTNSIAYISARTNSTQYSVITATGATPTSLELTGV